jgi:hypothetical protein
MKDEKNENQALPMKKVPPVSTAPEGALVPPK